MLLALLRCYTSIYDGFIWYNGAWLGDTSTRAAKERSRDILAESIRTQTHSTRQACLSHPKIVIWISFWYLTKSTNIQILRRQCCLHLTWQGERRSWILGYVTLDHWSMTSARDPISQTKPVSSNQLRQKGTLNFCLRVPLCLCSRLIIFRILSGFIILAPTTWNLTPFRKLQSKQWLHWILSQLHL